MKKLHWVLIWAYVAHMAAIAGINIWLGFSIDEVAYILAGYWQMFAGLFFLMWMLATNNMRTIGRMSLEALDYSSEVIEELSKELKKEMLKNDLNKAKDDVEKLKIENEKTEEK